MEHRKPLGDRQSRCLQVDDCSGAGWLITDEMIMNGCAVPYTNR
jgi:hypothetical protein